MASSVVVDFIEQMVLRKVIYAKVRLEERWKEIASQALSGGNGNTPVQGGDPATEQERVLSALEHDEEYTYLNRFLDKVEACIHALDNLERAVATMIADDMPDEQIRKELNINRRKFYATKSAAMYKLAKMLLGFIIHI